MKQPRNLKEANLKLPNRRLGKQPARIDKRTLRFSDYRRPQPGPLPQPPEEISYVVKVPSWPMLLNDQLGDCVIAAMGHMVQQWTYFASGGADEQVMTDPEALAAYMAITGYNPADPSTDRGIDMITALNYWRNTGIVVGGRSHQIAGYVAVDPANLAEVREAIWLFGNLFTGVQLPTSVISADDWTVPDGGIYGLEGQPGGWGGHCIPTMAESPETLTCITWGERLKMSHNFLLDYSDEAYAVLSSDWFNSQGQAPSGFDAKRLKQDIAAL